MMATLRFMSWNWNCFSDGQNERKLALIDRLNPSVVALQEVDRAAWTFLKESAEDWTAYMPSGWATDEWAEDGRKQPIPSTALLVRSGMTVSPIEPPDLSAWTKPTGRWSREFSATFAGDDTEQPEHRAFMGAQVAVGDAVVTVVSAHPPHAAADGPEQEARRILRKRRTYEVLRQWIADKTPLVIGMDANAWIDSGLEPLSDGPKIDPGNAQHDIGMFLYNGFIDGEEDVAAPRDAFRIWLAENDVARKDIETRRPFGPWAMTYIRSTQYARADRRDLVMVSRGIAVTNVEHNYEDSLAAGSDHSYVLCDLEI